MANFRVLLKNVANIHMYLYKRVQFLRYKVTELFFQNNIDLEPLCIVPYNYHKSISSNHYNLLHLFVFYFSFAKKKILPTKKENPLSLNLP